MFSRRYSYSSSPEKKLKEQTPHPPNSFIDFGVGASKIREKGCIFVCWQGSKRYRAVSFFLMSHNGVRRVVTGLDTSSPLKEPTPSSSLLPSPSVDATILRTGGTDDLAASVTAAAAVRTTPPPPSPVMDVRMEQTLPLTMPPLQPPTEPPMPPNAVFDVTTNSATATTTTNEDGHIMSPTNAEPTTTRAMPPSSSSQTHPSSSVSFSQESIIYYAIRKGNHGLTGALFSSRHLALPYIQPMNNGTSSTTPPIEYQTFTNSSSALQYLQSSLPSNSNIPSRTVLERPSTPPPTQAILNPKPLHRPPSVSYTNHHHPNTTASIGQVRKGRSLGLKAMQNPNRRPTKVWEKMYAQYVAYVVATGSQEFKKPRKPRAEKSVTSGSSSAGGGGATSGTAAAGGDGETFIVDGNGAGSVGEDGGTSGSAVEPETMQQEGNSKSNTNTTNHAITTKSKEAPPEDEYNDLARWVRQQQNEYRYWKEGRPSSMFPAKVEKLREVGFEFKYISMEERIQALLKFKDVHGHYNIPENHPTLGQWMVKQKKAAKKFATDKDCSPYFELKIEELKSLGVIVKDPSLVPSSASKKDNNTSSKSPASFTVKALSNESFAAQSYTPSEEDEQKWNSFYSDLVEYKKVNGHCDVPPSAHTPLSYWVTKQHAEYQKIKEANNSNTDGSSVVSSKLTLSRLQRLVDLGFVFRHLTKTFTWDERMEQLRKYKEEHGHVRVPKSHSELGVFVNRQRYEWSKWQDGRPSTMTEERIRDLQNLNFVFCAGRKMAHVDYKNKKTWDERYDDLLRFKEEHGHAVVPQSYPGLGEWVHTQRMYYKKLKTGKKTPLTSERVMKLADIGFVFDATKRRGTQVGSNVENEHLDLINLQFQAGSRM